MNPNKMTRPELVDFTTNAATGVADGKVTGFLAEQNTAFSDALTDANAVLAAANLNCVEAKTAYSASCGIAQNAADEVKGILQNLKDAMKGVNSPGVDYSEIGFDPPIEVPTPVIPSTPTELAATGFSNGTNRLTFVGNNVPGSVTYSIEAIIGDTAPYVLVGTTQAQKWTHEGVTPGEFYQYRVRAQAARGVVSEWSNTAVVYGIAPPA